MGAGRFTSFYDAITLAHLLQLTSASLDKMNHRTVFSTGWPRTVLPTYRGTFENHAISTATDKTNYIT